MYVRVKMFVCVYMWCVCARVTRAWGRVYVRAREREGVCDRYKYKNTYKYKFNYKYKYKSISIRPQYMHTQAPARP